MVTSLLPPISIISLIQFILHYIWQFCFYWCWVDWSWSMWVLQPYLRPWEFKSSEFISSGVVFGNWWGVWEVKIGRKWGQNRVRISWQRGRQVGAFSVFSPGDTGIPFIIWPFFVFFRKIDRFRGWCNITPKSCPKLAGFLMSVILPVSVHCLALDFLHLSSYCFIVFLFSSKHLSEREYGSSLSAGYYQSITHYLYQSSPINIQSIISVVCC